MNTPVATLPRGLSRWRGRNVSSQSGYWSELRQEVPEFDLWPFTADGGASANPHLVSVVRLPLRREDQPIPVGVVSPNYGLVQHRALGDLCVDTLRRLNLFYDRLRCEVELTELGEWMALRFYLGDDFSLSPPDGHPLDLRLELFNSVDGSSRLLLVMSWFRLVCSNGLTVRDTLTQIADIHDSKLDLSRLDDAIVMGIDLANADREKLSYWFGAGVREEEIAAWVDGPVAAVWGKKAAARCLYICQTGSDGEILNPFAGGMPSERTLRSTRVVPGAARPATSLYDVSQALSWIATNRSNVEERLAWQTDIPKLVAELEHVRGRP
jgi:hypothetical protein